MFFARKQEMTVERDSEALPRYYVTQGNMSWLTHKLKFVSVIRHFSSVGKYSLV